MKNKEIIDNEVKEPVEAAIVDSETQKVVTFTKDEVVSELEKSFNEIVEKAKTTTNVWDRKEYEIKLQMLREIYQFFKNKEGKEREE